MELPHWLNRFLWSWALSALALGASGCMPFLHGIDPPPTERVTSFKVIPSPCRGQIHVFIVHGMDPFDWANLKGLKDYIHALGFRKVYLGQMIHAAGYEKEMTRIHQEDPDARFVLIGFSFGANIVRAMANRAKEEGIPIELLVYMGGNTLKNEPRDQPENVARVINVLAVGCIWNGATMDRAENIQLTDVYHFGSPSHPQTLDVLARELAHVAEQGTWKEPLCEAPPALPLPKEWNFLEPTRDIGLGKPSLGPPGPPR